MVTTISVVVVTLVRSLLLPLCELLPLAVPVVELLLLLPNVPLPLPLPLTGGGGSPPVGP
jgi:hypothetical protein